MHAYIPKEKNKRWIKDTLWQQRLIQVNGAKQFKPKIKNVASIKDINK